MKKGLSKAVSFCMMIGLLAQSLYIPAMAEEAATEIAAEVGYRYLSGWNTGICAV